MALDVPTIRLSIYKDGSVNTMIWPAEAVMFALCEKKYDTPDGLPHWIKEKLAVLMLIDPDEPNKKDVVGVGRRISENIYWVYPDGFHTREESKDQSP